MTKSGIIATAIITGLVIPAGSVGIHHLSKVTIGDHPYIKENALSTDGKALDEDWVKLENKLPSIRDKIKDKSLKNIKPGSNRLRKWCAKAYATTYESLYFWQNTSLLSDVSIACVLTIRDKIGIDKTFDPDKDNKPTLTRILEKESQNIYDIEEINEYDPNQEERWRLLEVWCFNAYNQSYTGHKSNTWRLANEFCRNE